MSRWTNTFARLLCGRKRRPIRRPYLSVLALEERCLLDGAPFQHVLILSVDGLRNADLADPVLQSAVNPGNGQLVLTNMLNLAASGVTYTNASTSQPRTRSPEP